MLRIHFALALFCLLAIPAQAEKVLQSPVYLYPIQAGKTASEVCYEKKKSCIGVTTAELHDDEGEFYGFATPSCDSQIIEEEKCEKDFGTKYAINDVVLKKSPNSDSDRELGGDYFCISSDDGKKGIYKYANCVDR